MCPIRVTFTTDTYNHKSNNSKILNAKKEKEEKRERKNRIKYNEIKRCHSDEKYMILKFINDKDELKIYIVP